MRLLDNILDVFFPSQGGAASAARELGKRVIGDRPPPNFSRLISALKDQASRPANIDELPTGVYAHNAFTVKLAQADMDRLEARRPILNQYITDLVAEMETFFKEKGYRTFGPIQLRIEGSEDVGTGYIAIDSTILQSGEKMEKYERATPPLEEDETRTVFKTVIAPQGRNSAMLTIRKGEQKGQVFTISRPVTTIGLRLRGNSPDIAIDDADLQISRRHVQIEESETGFQIIDTRSTNGTLVNHDKLAPETARALADGDRITLAGKVEIEFRLLKDAGLALHGVAA